MEALSYAIAGFIIGLLIVASLTIVFVMISIFKRIWEEMKDGFNKKQ